ncbi:MAG: DpnI domain-containing protein, partial [Bacteroidaceae bacterium]|nr:DpnI domain-containing protein [Bacteroidaceae bacterium]
MNLTLDFDIARSYKSKSQKYRVITETWLEDNLYCP